WPLVRSVVQAIAIQGCLTEVVNCHMPKRSNFGVGTRIDWLMFGQYSHVVCGVDFHSFRRRRDIIRPYELRRRSLSRLFHGLGNHRFGNWRYILERLLRLLLPSPSGASPTIAARVISLVLCIWHGYGLLLMVQTR